MVQSRSREPGGALGVEFSVFLSTDHGRRSPGLPSLPSLTTFSHIFAEEEFVPDPAAKASIFSNVGLSHFAFGANGKLSLAQRVPVKDVHKHPLASGGAKVSKEGPRMAICMPLLRHHGYHCGKWLLGSAPIWDVDIWGLPVSPTSWDAEVMLHRFLVEEETYWDDSEGSLQTNIPQSACQKKVVGPARR